MTRMTTNRAVIVWVGVLSLAVGLSGASAAERADDSEVPLYTNADLEKFATPAADNEHPDVLAGESGVSAGPPPSASVDNPWAFVRDFIDREHDQIDVRHRQAVEWAAVEASRPIEPEGEPGFDYPVGLPYIGYPDWRCDRGPDCGRRIGIPEYRDRLPWYDLRTARHGYLVPRKRTSPDGVARPHARSGHPGIRPGGSRSGGVSVGRAVVSRSASRSSGVSARRAAGSRSASRSSSGRSANRAASGGRAAARR